MAFVDTKIIILLLFQVSMFKSEELQSPCPDVFEFKNDRGVLYGIIRTPIMNSGPTILTKINFTIASALPSRYTGKLEYLGQSQTPSEESVGSYRVDFPVTGSVPKISSITVNNNVLCDSPEGVPRPGQLVSIVTLQHTMDQPSGLFASSGNPTSDPLATVETSGLPMQTESPIDIFVKDMGKKPSKKYAEQLISKEETAKANTQPITTWPFTRRARSPVSSALNTSVECGINRTPFSFSGIGHLYDRGEWPWLVAIYKRKDDSLNFICSGTLVSDQHVITAAHCIQKKFSLTPIKDIIVKVGIFDLGDWADEESVARSLASAHIHENFSPDTLANDIMIMKLKSRVTFSDYIQPICLWQGDPDLDRIVGKNGVIAGWEKNEFGAQNGEPSAVRIPIVSTTTCRASRPGFHQVTSKFTLCAGGKDEGGPCLNSGGGGLYYCEKGHCVLRGVLSLALLPKNGRYECNLRDYLVFTDTAHYVDWIKNVVQ